MSPQPFDLNIVIRNVLDSSRTADPGQLATEVYRQIPANQRGAALMACLRSVVRQAITRQQMTSEAATPARPGSWKVSGVRKAWEEQLRERIHVGDSNWKLLADCTRDELLFAAAERRRLAAQNLAKAERFEALASAMATQGAETVNQLSETVLDETLKDAA